MASGGSGHTQSIRARLLRADQLLGDGALTEAASVYCWVASAYARAGRPNEAHGMAMRAQELAPAWFTINTAGAAVDALGVAGVPICTAAAEAHWRAGRAIEALQFYYQATQLDPNDPTALIRLGQAYEHQMLLKEATATFVVASRCLLQRGSTEEFIAAAEQILRIDGGHTATLRELAKAYLRVGEPRRAVATLTALMQVVPDDPAGYEILAQAFACIGKQDVALSLLARLCGDLRAQGDADEAGELLWRASRWQPGDLGFQRSLTGLADNEIPKKLTDNDEPAREGTMVLGPEDISHLDEDSGVYRDRDGTNVLSMRDIAIVDELLQSASVKAAEPHPETPRPPRRPTSRRVPNRFDDAPILVAEDARHADRKRRPLLTKHEGTIILDLRELAILGDSREESIVLDISDVQDVPEYRLPDLIVDEESGDIELSPSDLHTIRKEMPARLPPSRGAGNSEQPPSVKTAVPLAIPGKPAKPVAADIDEERPTAMMSMNAADVVADLFNSKKKKRTGRDRSASLLETLGPKPKKRPAATPSKRRRRKAATTTAPQATVGKTLLPPMKTPAISGHTQVSGRPEPAQDPRSTGRAPVMWAKPTAPKRGKPKK